jgi:hypothetical protein
VGKRARRRGQDGAGGEPAEDGGAGPVAEAAEPLAETPQRWRVGDGLRGIWDEVTRLEIALLLHRFVLMQERLPQGRDWDGQEGWPDTREIEDLFGSWAELMDYAELPEERLRARWREAEQVTEELALLKRERPALREEVDRARHQLAELGRRLESAQRLRDEERERRRDVERALDEVRRQVDELRAAAPSPEPAPAAEEPPEPEPEDPLAERLRRELEAERARAQAAADAAQEAREALERERRTVASLTRQLATGPEEAGEGDEAGDDAPDEPRTVLEAVEQAATRATHLVFARRAFASAEASPFRRPQLVLDTLLRLDRLAARYADPAGMGKPLLDAAEEEGLSGWVPDISATAAERYRAEYTFTHEGRELLLGPHVRLGTGSGAGSIARIYLTAHPGDDELPRGLIVGHVGRKLRDTTV